MDGHSSLDFRVLDTIETQHFSTVLTALETRSDGVVFVVHATEKVSRAHGLTPDSFLSTIGFMYFADSCRFLPGACSYKEIAQTSGTLKELTANATDPVREAYKSFANRLEELFELRWKEWDILTILYELDGFRNNRNHIGRSIFNAPIQYDIDPNDPPAWVEEVKFDKLRSLEAQKKDLENQIEELAVYLPLLFASGNQLEIAVRAGLRRLGLKADLTSPGETVDVLAETASGERKFGFEVTGTKDAIKKSSKKLTQILEFERIKEGAEKAVLIANTYRDSPIEERVSNVHFTQPVVDHLEPHPILLMTGYDLYRLIGMVIEGEISEESIIDRLYSEKGVFDIHVKEGDN